MLSKKLYVLDQMLKRHKIEAEINTETAEIKVGKAKMGANLILIYFVLPTILLAVMVALHLSLDLGRVKVYKFIYGLPLTLLAYGVNVYLGNKGANTTRKILTQDACQIIGKKKTETVVRSQMASVTTLMHTEDPSGLEGEVYLHTTDRKKCLLFRIRSEKLNYLRDDLDKMQDTLNALWQLD